MQAPLQARNDADATKTDTARTVAQKRVLADNRPEAVVQRKMAETMNNSPRVLQQRALSDAIHNSPRMVAQRHEMNALFGGAVKPQGDGAMPPEASLAQCEEKTNRTGMPNQLKSGIESLSGMSMDHVTVHYNSDKPAQLQAHAYAQGTEIHLGAGQERHLPHEAWHVVQQAQNRVPPTLHMKAGAVNDDPSLEKEADMMGEKAAQFEGDHSAWNLVAEERVAGAVTQRVAGFHQRDLENNRSSSSPRRLAQLHRDSSMFGPTMQLMRTVGVVQRAILNVKGVDGLPVDTDNPIGLSLYIRDAVQKNDLGSLHALTSAIKAKDPDQLQWLTQEIGKAQHTENLLMLRRRQFQHEPFSQQDEANLMTRTLGSPVGQNTGPEIPQHIHRFWTGGKISASAMTILIDSAKRAAPGWKHTLWHSTGIESELHTPPDDKEMLASQRAQLAELGYDIRPIEGLVNGPSGITADDMAEATGQAAKRVRFGGEDRFDDVKYFSDLARLMYLHDIGGHHMDVDIGLGRMDTSGPYRHNDPNGQIPLLGTLARDNSDNDVISDLRNVNKLQDRPNISGATDYLNSAERLVGKAHNAGSMFNALIASQPGTENLKAGIAKLAAPLRKNNKMDRGLSSGMSVNSDLLLGPHPDPERLEAAAALSVPPYLLRLEHLTPESDA